MTHFVHFKYTASIASDSYRRFQNVMVKWGRAHFKQGLGQCESLWYVRIWVSTIMPLAKNVTRNWFIRQFHSNISSCSLFDHNAKPVLSILNRRINSAELKKTQKTRSNREHLANQCWKKANFMARAVLSKKKNKTAPQVLWPLRD